jgi:tetratricopeptide (TPR) repeat protein
MWRIAIALSVLGPIPAAGRAVDKKRLQELLYFPAVEFGMNLQYYADTGVVLKGAKPDYSREIAQLRKAMLGDARDAERYHRIARLYSVMNAEAESDKAFVQAEKLYRERLKRQPNDTMCLSELGDLLAHRDHNQEAERLLRKAVERAPKNWHCWVNLGQFLETAAVALSQPSGHTFKTPKEATGLVQAGARTTPDKTSHATSLLSEATACFNKAVACGPHQARPYYERYIFRLCEVQVVASLHIPHEQTELANPSVEQEIVADTRHATELEPANVAYAAHAILIELLDSEVDYDETGVWKSLAVEVQHRLKKYLNRIEHLTHSDDRTTAVGAHLVLAAMAIALFGDMADGERHCRCALSIDPTQDSSWGMLLALLNASENHEACLSTALDWLKQSESAQKHYIVSQCYAELKQWRLAEDHVRAALRSRPNDAAANMALGVLFMKRSDEPSSLAEADKYLKAAKKLMNEDTPQDLRLDYDVTLGIYSALKGDIERARSLFKSVQEKDPKRKTPGKALEALK